jgi:carbon-monoxide dehydrogenase medium subunit
MKPAPFNLLRPRNVDEALALLQSYRDEAKVLAGGQSLVPLMNFRLAQPHNLISTAFEGRKIKLTTKRHAGASCGSGMSSVLQRSPNVCRFSRAMGKSPIWHPQPRGPSEAVWSAPIRAELLLLAVALDATSICAAGGGAARWAKDFIKLSVDRYRAG